MKMTFEYLFPALRPWVVNLVNVWPAYIIKPQFAAWEVLHILSLILLGGTAILMNLRLIGVGVIDEPPSEVYRNLRRWQDLGVIGIVVSGVLIGMANAERLYDSTAFVVKMTALASGVILTYGASRSVARADGAVGRGAKISLLAGGALFLLGVGVFVTGTLINVGLFHVLTAAALLVLIATQGRQRWIYLAGLLLLIAVQSFITHGLIQPDDLARLDPVNKAFFGLFAAWIFGAAAIQLFAPVAGRDSTPVARLIGYVTILVWVTAAAAGRWIAFA